MVALILFSINIMIYNIVCSTFWLPQAFYPFRLHLLKDQKLLNSDQRTQLENKIKQLAESLGINKKINVVERKSVWSTAQAQGSALFPGKAGILIDVMIWNEFTEGEREFVLAHELAHIKNNDVAFGFCTCFLVQVVTTVALSILFPPLGVVHSLFWGNKALIIGCAAALVAFSIFSKWREECADKLALSVCSKQGVEGAVTFFAPMEQDTSRLNIFERIWYTEEGETRLNILHPSVAKRRAYCKDYLTLRYPPGTPALA